MLASLLLLLATLTAAPAQGPIPPTYFGMILEFPTVTPKPQFYYGQGRMWDNQFSGVETNWSDIETALNTYPGGTWNNLDSVVALLLARNVVPAYTFFYGYGANWQTGGTWPTGSQAPTDISTNIGLTNCGITLTAPCYGSPMLANFVSTLVTRYKGKIGVYGCWNEGDLTSYWNDTVAKLAAMCSNIFTLVHSIDPNAIVVSPSTGGGASGPTWMQGYLAAASAGPWFDRFNMHCYPFNTSVPPEFIVNQIAYNYYAMQANSLSAPMQCDEFDESTATVDPVFVAVSYILGYPAGLLNLSWYQYDNTTSTLGSLQGSVLGLSPAGLAAREVNNWLLGATWSTPPTRTANANGIRNTTFTGAVVGQPGTAPTHMTAASSDSGVLSSIVSTSAGQVCWSLVGTSASGGNGQFALESIGQIAASVGQVWTFGVGVSLITTGGSSLTNVGVQLIFQEYNAGGAGLGSDQQTPALVPISGLSAATQLYWGPQTLTQATVASVVPVIFVPFGAGSVNVQICLGGAPYMDNGSLWSWALTRINGAKSVIAWDAANTGNGVLSFTTTAGCGGSNCGVYRDVLGQTHLAGSSVPLTKSPVLFDVAQQAIRFN